MKIKEWERQKDGYERDTESIQKWGLIFKTEDNFIFYEIYFIFFSIAFIHFSQEFKLKEIERLISANNLIVVKVNLKY